MDKVYEEIADFFARGFTSAEAIAFRPSEKAQARVRVLLERSKSGELTNEENLEIHRLGELEHLLQLVKARAHFYVDKASRHVY